MTRPAKLPAGSCLLHLDANTSDQQAIRAVLNAEGELVVKQDINQLMALWADGAFVADANNTPTNRDDDEFWRNKDAIRHRYVRIVFPGAPSAATPADLTIQTMDDRAVVTATTQIGSEISPAGDRWELVKTDNCWLLKSLTFNLEANKSK
ncbi:MAG: nuclear transport factor 2 family protein [Chloroflexi bacterium]|nr:nuclear transport factor 2 family protein [Chloroflexota bacterium]